MKRLVFILLVLAAAASVHAAWTPTPDFKTYQKPETTAPMPAVPVWFWVDACVLAAGELGGAYVLCASWRARRGPRSKLRTRIERCVLVAAVLISLSISAYWTWFALRDYGLSGDVTGTWFGLSIRSGHLWLGPIPWILAAALALSAIVEWGATSLFRVAIPKLLWIDGLCVAYLALRGFLPPVFCLVYALWLAAHLVIWRRSRRGVFWLSMASLAYFGFWLQGCICPVGSIQNVSLSIAGSGYALPWAVALLFGLPLLTALVAGRVFCAAVCPLGAIQDVVLWRPVKVPVWVEAALGLLPYVYLALAVMYAICGGEFVVCRFDPFVAFFRRSGATHMLIFGGLLLVTSMFVGRTYCRFLCPYSVLLKWMSILSWKRVEIAPSHQHVPCVECHLCSSSCPFGAIQGPLPRAAAGRRFEGRGLLGIMLGAAPVIVAAAALIGWVSGPALKQLDPGYQQATAALTAPEPGPAGAAERLVVYERRFHFGGMAAGGFIGLVIAAKLIASTMRRPREEYRADPASCLACGRCYLTCPVEHVRLEKVGAAS